MPGGRTFGKPRWVRRSVRSTPPTCEGKARVDPFYARHVEGASCLRVGIFTISSTGEFLALRNLPHISQACFRLYWDRYCKYMLTFQHFFEINNLILQELHTIAQCTIRFCKRYKSIFPDSLAHFAFSIKLGVFFVDFDDIFMKISTTFHECDQQFTRK